ncbi:hypothetical protein LOK49_LG01G02899 [Camellia lanceoleosa]|uniref:Uncharacterized protein n=1 Tax=Camellia lanceoleosa TaxID=1840588 RepID=A0ACC0IVA9_9ERIC|nr:hypothetical protein LOK49_LG01G02899 [Camellia lanceoleosa]
MGVATALYSATCFAQGKYGNGIDYPVNLRAIDLSPEVREAQEKKLEGIKKQQEIHNRLAVERKIFLCDRKIKFFERRKIERRIRRLEKMQRFFPKTEKYVSLFMGGDDMDIVDRRNRLRKQIKANIIAAAASGKDLEGYIYIYIF